MTVQFSMAVRNTRLDSIESTAGASPRLCFYTGSPPASTVATYTGIQLADYVLPGDWLAAAASGVKNKVGTWSGNATSAGVIGYFRIKDSAGTTVHMQGTCTATGAGGDMTLDSTTVASGQAITVITFTLTDPNG